jgi:Universal stress protein UspA and related nucleotide-binding proteins
MNFKRILVAFDGSEQSKKALEVALDLSKKYDAELSIVEVIPTELLAGMGFTPIPDSVINQIFEKARKDMDYVKNLLSKEGIKFRTDILQGDPGTEIVNYSNKNNIDLIVTGSRGLSGVKKLFLGSVSSKIVSEAKVAVLVVK